MRQKSHLVVLLLDYASQTFDLKTAFPVHGFLLRLAARCDLTHRRVA